jgi:hypothetical protein
MFLVPHGPQNSGGATQTFGGAMAPPKAKDLFIFFQKLKIKIKIPRMLYMINFNNAEI